MKRIPLTQKKFALVDDEDYEYLNQWKWCYIKGKQGSGYALRRPWINGKEGKAILMHRLIMNTPDGMECDHQDGDGINNQKYNLRNCSSTENKRNQKKRPGTSSIYKGVYRCKQTGMWQCNVGKFRIGRFRSEQHAAMAYDLWAIDIYGEFASTNFPIIGRDTV